MKVNSRGGEESLTERQRYLLTKLLEDSKAVNVHTVYKSQNELAREMGITRQALSIHLRKFKEAGLIRTGRGFIDLTDKALQLLEVKSVDAFVFIKVKPQMRVEAYKEIKKILEAEKIYRVTGDVDIVAIVDQTKLSKFLKKVSKVEGVISTSAHVVVEKLKE
ncbi:MAG: Lrp/AsnC family transcriptional regulator [archaeon GB-1867-097]|nr:Lrp/AsnC family transcriptional regulator [Candidatus Culexmicrobium thermophilum]MCS7384306.1 Lrp/AsnC family transcriptional regulator [Candidatus Culexmicrobium thermophilum]HDO21057.1 Lrp/AsnC family transcriptional regulator [Candidatus Bathyarchaeota archaeon]